MGITEVVLLILGGIVFVLSFVLPKKKEELDEDTKKLAGEQIRDILNKEINMVQSKVEDVVEETIEESSEKTERALERLTNEKIMAINEYADTVIEDVNKNHKEVLFLYDMLNDKHVTIRNTVVEVEKTVGEVTQTAKDIEISAKEAEKQAKKSEETAKQAAEITGHAEKAAQLTAQNIEMDVRRIVEDMIRGKVEETLEKTAVTMIQSRVDEILKDAAFFIEEQQPKIVIGSRQEEVLKQEELLDAMLKQANEPAAESVIEPSAELDIKPAIESGIEDITESKLGTQEKDISEEKMPEEIIEEIIEEIVPEETFKAGITDGVPQIVLEGGEQENLQYYVIDSENNIDKEINSEADSETEEANQNRNSNEKILSLHKAGMSNMAIARELGLGVGEVKLVIDLFEGIHV